MLLAFASLKARFDADIGPATRDGDYYYTIARSVHDGEGGRTATAMRVLLYASAAKEGKRVQLEIVKSWTVRSD